MPSKRRSAGTVLKLRMFARKLASAIAVGFLFFAAYANWFVRHSNDYLNEKRETLPGFIAKPLFATGEVCADLTDSFGLTGSDATCAIKSDYKAGNTFFAGIPRAKTDKASKDITIVDKGEFTIAYSERLRHPVWCAYKIPAKALYSIESRPNFRKDGAFKSCPAASAYARTGYDRGHMAPNHAIASRYGLDAQKKTFLMTNITPQTPELNRGIWRELEHRIADLFTAKWGDVWVIVGAVSDGSETLSGTDIGVPTSFYQIVTAKSENEIRVLAFLVDQQVGWGVWPRHYITSIDHLEEMTGFDFLSDLEDDVEEKIESQIPTRLWPVKFLDAFKALKIHLKGY